MSLSLGSEIAAGSSGDNSPSLHRLLQEREQRGMKGPGRRFVLQLLVLCPHGKAGSKDHKWKNISYRERVWLEASLRTEQVLCLSSLQLPVYALPQGMLMLVFPKSSAGDAGRLQVWIPGEFEIQTGS